MVAVCVLPFVGEISSLISGHSEYKERVAIFLAVEDGDIEAVSEALEEGVDVNSRVGEITRYEGSKKFSIEEGITLRYIGLLTKKSTIKSLNYSLKRERM